MSQICSTKNIYQEEVKTDNNIGKIPCAMTFFWFVTRYQYLHIIMLEKSLKLSTPSNDVASELLSMDYF